MNDLYAILGIPKTASAEEIKKAYREKALKYHPDRNPGDAAAEEQFKKLSEAYAVLGDEENRIQYDTYGHAGPNPYQQRSGTRPYGQEEFDPFEELFRQQTRRSAYTWYGYGFSPRQEDRNTSISRKETLLMLLKGVLSFILGLFFFRYSLFLGIFGLVICLTLIISGAADSVRALQYLFSGRRKT
ncbi:MAG: DnaJ domain-containing protein [Spirochaetaceae bacterium]|jgi:molecular chaperone DnaJ|nr:DnaJ domain-containing protein [Spirochaetaceae bacterium]